MTTPESKHKILFICTGNLCRSPMAEYQLKYMASHVGATNIIVGSAGVIAQNGEPASENAVAVMQENGIDMSVHKSKPLTQKMVDWADRILVMEDYHYRIVSRYFKRTDGKLQLLSEYAPKDAVPKEIKDPYGEMITFYRKTYNEIKRSIAGLFARISDV